MTAKKNFPAPSKTETRAEQTTAIANEIIEKEKSERGEKTDRLRAARLQREDEDRAEAEKPVAKGKTKAKPKAKSKGAASK